MIAAAEEVFAPKGFKETSTQDIAELAGAPRIYRQLLKDIALVWAMKLPGGSPVRHLVALR